MANKKKSRYKNRDHIYPDGDRFKIVINGKTKRADTREEAKAIRLQMMNENSEKSKNVFERYEYTFADIADLNVEYLKNNRDIATANKKKQMVNQIILPNMPNKQFKDINKDDTESFRSKLLKMSYSTRYKNTILIEFKAIFNFAKNHMDLLNNSANGLEKFKKNIDDIEKEETKNESIWSPEEFSKFIGYVEEEKYKLFFIVLMTGMMRLGECIALKWKDYDGESIRIWKSQSKDKNSLNKTKTPGSIRIVYLPKQTCQLLDSYKKKEMRKIGFADDWFIFNRWDGNKELDGYKYLARTTITRRKDEAVRLSGVKRITLHDQRHSGITHALENGAELKTVSKIAGHSSVAVTENIYHHVLEKNRKEISSQMEDYVVNFAKFAKKE